MVMNMPQETEIVMMDKELESGSKVISKQLTNAF